MGLSFVDFASTGARVYPFHGLEYLSTSHLVAKVNGTPVSATFDGERREVTLAATPAVGATIRIQRVTPRGNNDRLVNFLSLADGAPGLTSSLLETDQRQLNFILGEGRDVATSLPNLSGMGLLNEHWHATSKRIENIALGVDSADAARKDQLDTVVASARNLPTVTGADNDDVLAVNAGEWDDRLPAEGRTHWGLGTVAVLDAGVAANNVAQFDGSARYPTADGRNIDLTNHPLMAEFAKRARTTVCRLQNGGEAGQGLDVTLNTWSHNSSSRFDLAGGVWTARVELDNSSDIDASVNANGVVLAAGTWRIRWVLRFRQTAGAGSNVSFRLTDNDDTSSQVVHLDYGVMRATRQFAGGQAWYLVVHDELIIANASQFALVFRYGMATTGANNDCAISLLFHKISTSVLA